MSDLFRIGRVSWPDVEGTTVPRLYDEADIKRRVVNSRKSDSRAKKLLFIFVYVPVSRCVYTHARRTGSSSRVLPPPARLRTLTEPERALERRPRKTLCVNGRLDGPWRDVTLRP